jgi:prevent-host-death family protein
MARRRNHKSSLVPEAPGRREIPAGQFKARCLALMDRVRERGEEYVITKHGKPVAKLVPVEEEAPKSAFGWMKGSLLEYGDIISPVAVEDWEVLQDDVAQKPPDHEE